MRYLMHEIKINKVLFFKKIKTNIIRIWNLNLNYISLIHISDLHLIYTSIENI